MKWSVRTEHHPGMSAVLFDVSTKIGHQRFCLFREKCDPRKNTKEEKESVRSYCEFMAKMFVVALSGLGLKGTRVRKGCARSK